MFVIRISMLIGFCVCIAKAEWNKPYFRKTSREDVKFGGYLPAGQLINMDEEIEPPIPIAIITNYQGSSSEPEITFTKGKNVTLGLTVEKIETEWILYVNNQQDYENVDMQNYVIKVTLDGTSANIRLYIENIFDNPPTITAESTSCSAEELRKNFKTNCTFNVFDADGFEDNDITFEIQGKFNESILFRLDLEEEIDDYNGRYVLYVQEELNYNQRNLYNFKIIVRDIELNEGNINFILNVEDVPSEDPIWIQFFATARFPEKTEQEFQVKAVDGDLGINKPICYRLDFEKDRNYSDIISIHNETGKIFVREIDRDARKNEFYPFQIIAYKCYNESWAIIGQAALIVDDVNDNYPEITLPIQEIQLNEEQFLNNIFNSTLYIEDIDLGAHATYDVILSQSENSKMPYSEAFMIIPGNGYQKQKFDVNVITGKLGGSQDRKLIDYEDEDWRKFSVMIVATEQDDKTRQRNQSFSVKLLNWNDEIPIFEENSYEFFVQETVEGNTFIGSVKATDKDVDDEVQYFLVGGINDTITHKINDEKQCELYTKNDNAFDYERQKEVIFQIRAEDTLQTMGEKTHQVFAQIKISVVDVNDKTPQLIMPRKILEIQENVRDATITTEIEAHDPDTTADLTLEIDWKNSYASKPGFIVDKEFYEGCFIIEKVEETNNKVFGHLKVNSSFKYNIDYEKYEIIYLNMKVIDNNQEVNSNQSTALLVVLIGDENDNPPEFVGDTLIVNRNVLEEATSGTLVGNIVARDIDGPGNNIINYQMIPINDTPENLIEIASETGVMSVKADREIDCDTPRRDFLEYTIILYDGANETKGDIKIHITDTNNKYPQVESKEIEAEPLYENATSGDLIRNIKAWDWDRDDPHNVIQFTINYVGYPNLQKYFAIDQISGRLEVNLTGNNELDRDHGEDTHFIYVNLEDNFLGNGARNKNDTLVILTLLDVNDNAPEMPNIEEFVVSENTDENYVIEKQFFAEDIDDPKTPNSKVSYKILSIEPDDDTTPPDNGYKNLFKIEDDKQLKYGKISTAKKLKGYHGLWRVTIMAFDHGDEWDSRISLSSNRTYKFNVLPYNFYEPEILFPAPNSNIRLDFNRAIIGKDLVKIDGEVLEFFLAKDEDGGIFGDVNFTISSVLGNNDEDFFEMFKIDSKKSQFRLKKNITETTYNLNILATDGGGKRAESKNLKFSFIDLTGEPYFDPNLWATNFTENKTGLEETRIIPNATDPKNLPNQNEDKFEIFYFINKNFNPKDAKLFKLDNTSDGFVLSLAEELDRESVDFHRIQIIATNSKEYPTQPVSEKSLLTINITVNDVNDNAPTFENHFYSVGISESDAMDKTLIKLHATDPDLDDKISYYLLNGTMIATGEGIQDIKDTAFQVDKDSGDLILKTKLQSWMSGFFDFKVQANDLVNHTDQASVKIFIIADTNRVTFVLLNKAEEVRKMDRKLITEVFSDAYKYDCNIDDIVTADVEGVAQDMLSNLRAHFLKDNEAIDAREIQAKSSDISFITNLKSELLKINLNLQDVPINNSDGKGGVDQNETIALIFLVVSVILGIVCILITMAFFFRTKGLKRQIKALSQTTFHSVTPEFQKKPLPNTNYFATEKSNPALNMPKSFPKIEMDSHSISSNDSDDLSDVRNNPMFQQKKPAQNPLGLQNESSQA